MSNDATQEREGITQEGETQQVRPRPTGQRTKAVTEQQFQELIRRLDELQVENQRLRGRLDEMENPNVAAATSQQDRHRQRPKPANPQPFDPASKESNVRTWLFSLNMYFQAA